MPKSSQTEMKLCFSIVALVLAYSGVKIMYLILAVISVHHGLSIMKLPPSVSVGMTWEALSSAMTKKVLKRMLSWNVTA